MLFRLDFDNFVLPIVSSTAACTDTFLAISPTGLTSTPLCGTLTNQHSICFIFLFTWFAKTRVHIKKMIIPNKISALMSKSQFGFITPSWLILALLANLPIGLNAPCHVFSALMANLSFGLNTPSPVFFALMSKSRIGLSTLEKNLKYFWP